VNAAPRRRDIVVGQPNAIGKSLVEFRHSGATLHQERIDIYSHSDSEAAISRYMTIAGQKLTTHEIAKVRREIQKAAESVEETSGRETPQVIDIETLTVGYPRLREPVIHGLLRQGETLNVIASPKVGKSFLVAGLAWSIVDGRQWLSMDVAGGDVLVIDNELHKNTIVSRYQRIADEMQIPHDIRSGLHILPLRGLAMSIIDLARLPIEAGRYRLIVLDALYRFIPRGTSENDNAAMMAIYNPIDELAKQWQASIAIVHHSSKGDQSTKGLTDVGSGAGAISRAADSHLIIRPHEEPGLFVLEAVTRSFKSPAPISCSFEYPLWAASSVSPALKNNGSRSEQQSKIDEETKERILKAIGKRRMSTSQIRTATGFGDSRAKRGVYLLAEAEQIVSTTVRRKGTRKKIEVYSVAGRSENE